VSGQGRGHARCKEATDLGGEDFFELRDVRLLEAALHVVRRCLLRHEGDHVDGRACNGELKRRAAIRRGFRGMAAHRGLASETALEEELGDGDIPKQDGNVEGIQFCMVEKVRVGTYVLFPSEPVIVE
jgi:hypothetical protein